MRTKKYTDVEIISKMWSDTIQENGCWRYVGNKRRGHGTVYVNGKHRGVHQVSLEILKGIELTDSLIALHKVECLNRDCWNPDHLYAGSHSNNSKDIVLAGRHHEANKTHCPKGHPYDKMSVTPTGKKNRFCSICRRETVKLCMRRKRAKETGKVAPTAQAGV